MVTTDISNLRLTTILFLSLFSTTKLTKSRLINVIAVFEIWLRALYIAKSRRRLSPRKKMGDIRLDSSRSIFLKTGSNEFQSSAKECRCFRETKKHNGGEVLLAVLNFTCELNFVWRHSTLIIPSPISRRQSVTASVQKLPDSAVQSVSRARHIQSICQAKRSGYREVWG